MRHYLNGVTKCDCMGCRSADHDKDEKVDKLQNKEKKVDEIANTDEIKLKKIEEIKKSLRSMSAEELDEELEKLREELDNMKKEKTESKKASREHIGVDNYEAKGNYSVLQYNNISTIESREGDELLILMGSSN